MYDCSLYVTSAEALWKSGSINGILHLHTFQEFMVENKNKRIHT